MQTTYFGNSENTAENSISFIEIRANNSRKLFPLQKQTKERHVECMDLPNLYTKGRMWHKINFLARPTQNFSFSLISCLSKVKSPSVLLTSIWRKNIYVHSNNTVIIMKWIADCLAQYFLFEYF